MHYTRNYSHYRDSANKERAAIADIRKYLGSKRFCEIECAVRNAGYSWAMFQGCCENILGIEGYPVRVWAKALGVRGAKEEMADWDAVEEEYERFRNEAERGYVGLPE